MPSRRTDLMLIGKIVAIHRRARDAYGSPSIHAELADDHGIRVGRKRVARLICAADLRGVTLRKYVVTTTTPAMRSASAAAMPASCLRWAPWGTLTTTQWPRAYLPRWSER